METKKYSSYDEIELDLKILNVEREIHYQKILLNIEKTKECLVPSRSISFIADLYHKYFSGTYGTILKILIPYAIKWFINRKRGN